MGVALRREWSEGDEEKRLAQWSLDESVPSKLSDIRPCYGGAWASMRACSPMVTDRPRSAGRLARHFCRAASRCSSAGLRMYCRRLSPLSASTRAGAQQQYVLLHLHARSRKDALPAAADLSPYRHAKPLLQLRLASGHGAPQVARMPATSRALS